MKHRAANENNNVARDDQDREPGGKSSVFRIDFAPIADAECDDSVQEQALVGDWIENHPERTALVVSPGHIAIESVADGGEQEDHDRGKALPLEWFTALDALAIINRHRHEPRDHQNPDHGDFVGSRHGKRAMLKLEGLREKVARQFGGATARHMLPPRRPPRRTLYKGRHNMAGGVARTARGL